MRYNYVFRDVESFDKWVEIARKQLQEGRVLVSGILGSYTIKAATKRKAGHIKPEILFAPDLFKNPEDATPLADMRVFALAAFPVGYLKEETEE